MEKKQQNKEKSDTILKLSDISVRYHTPLQETLAIKDLNFSVYNKEFLTILGPSGCGKSTVLSLISGLIPTTHGKIEENIKTDDGIQKIGYMLQKDYLFIHFNFWSYWVFIAACRLSLVAMSKGFSLQWLLSLLSTGSRAWGFQ